MSWKTSIKIQSKKKKKGFTCKTGLGVRSGLRTSSLAEGARSSILTKLSATACCCSSGFHDAGNLLKEGNGNSRTSSAKGSTLK